MPNFKPLDYSPRFLAVDLSRQLVPGTFEYALHHLLEQEIELTEIEARYRNDGVGASAYEPAGAAQDHLAGLLLWHCELAGDAGGLSRQRALHCDLG